MLLDIWAKRRSPKRSTTTSPGPASSARLQRTKQREVFEIVRDARDAGVRACNRCLRGEGAIWPAGKSIKRHARHHRQKAGYGEYFIHRTGHSIGTEIHGNGANMDNLEIHDERADPAQFVFLDRAGHLPAGIRGAQRSEYDGAQRQSAEVTGKIQNEIVSHLMANSTNTNSSCPAAAKPVSYAAHRTCHGDCAPALAGLSRRWAT